MTSLRQIKSWFYMSGFVRGLFGKYLRYNGRIETREFLRMTVLLDHDLVDGAPAARAVDRTTDLMEQGWGLE